MGEYASLFLPHLAERSLADVKVIAQPRSEYRVLSVLYQVRISLGWSLIDRVGPFIF